ncbi:MAG TPA: ATP-binding protein [Thermoanaerobaculia bacterium]|nr:ATP-binding protein [Thermoanaerobaculia bacterium]
MTPHFAKPASRLAALALLGAAFFSPAAWAKPAFQPKLSTLDEEACDDDTGYGPSSGEEIPQGNAGTKGAFAERRVGSSWTLSSTRGYQILSLSDGERGELYLGTPDSGALRLQADNLEPLPPVSVDNGPFHLKVNAHSAQIPRDPVKEHAPYQPRARLTGVHVFGDHPSPPVQGKAAPATPNRNGFSFSFRGIDQGAHFSRFRYRLAGHDLDWIETNRCSARYPDLRPGDYRFEVKAANKAGLWSEPAGLTLQVIAPWWERPAVISLTASLLALAGGLLTTVRMRRLLHVERLRIAIASDLHDQVGAGLTDIAILSEVAALKAGDLPELSRVATTARELVDGLGDIVWLVNPRQDSLYELFLRLKDSYAELFAHAGAQLEVGDLSSFEGAHLSMTYRQDLHLLFKEALRNALRHSGCRRACLTVSLRRRALEVELSDDGRGFDSDHRNGSGEGLDSMRRRAARLGGKLSIDSSPEGTVVRFVGRLA